MRSTRQFTFLLISRNALLLSLPPPYTNPFLITIYQRTAVGDAGGDEMFTDREAAGAEGGTAADGTVKVRVPAEAGTEVAVLGIAGTAGKADRIVGGDTAAVGRGGDAHRRCGVGGRDGEADLIVAGQGAAVGDTGGDEMGSGMILSVRLR